MGIEDHDPDELDRATDHDDPVSSLGHRTKGDCSLYCGQLNNEDRGHADPREEGQKSGPVEGTHAQFTLVGQPWKGETDEYQEIGDPQTDHSAADPRRSRLRCRHASTPTSLVDVSAACLRRGRRLRREVHSGDRWLPPRYSPTLHGQTTGET